MSNDLTFAELRLASLLHLNSGDLGDTLADMVIAADRLAAAHGIDLAAAIRARFDPAEKALHDVTPSRKGAT